MGRDEQPDQQRDGGTGDLGSDVAKPFIKKYPGDPRRKDFLPRIPFPTICRRSPCQKKADSGQTPEGLDGPAGGE